MKNNWWKLLVISVIYLLLIIFKSENLWMGDGYTLRSYFDTISFYDNLKIDAFWISPLSIILLYIGNIYMTYIIGLIYMIYVFRFAQIDSKYIILSVLPIVQLFAGYMEIYALVYTMSLITFYYYRIQDGKKLWIFAYLTFFSHFVIGLPVLFFVSLNSFFFRKEMNYRIVKPVIGFSVMALYVMGMMIFFDRQQSFMPLTGDYSLFSPYHIGEMVILFGVIFLWILINEMDGNVKNVKFRDKALSLSVILSLVMTFILCPHLGIIRDWDLMSLSIIPVSMLYLFKTSRVKLESVIIMALFTIFFLWFNSSDRQDSMTKVIKDSPQYTVEFMNGKVLYATGYIAARETQNFELVSYVNSQFRKSKYEQEKSFKH